MKEKGFEPTAAHGSERRHSNPTHCGRWNGSGQNKLLSDRNTPQRDLLHYDRWTPSPNVERWQAVYALRADWLKHYRATDAADVNREYNCDAKKI